MGDELQELDKIIRNTEMLVEFGGLETEGAKSWVRNALHSARIYTAELDNDQNMESAIRVFEREKIGAHLNRKFSTGALNSHVLQQMEKAQAEGWHREPSFHCKVGGENHYFPYDLHEEPFKKWVKDTGEAGRGIYALEKEQDEQDGFFLGTGEKNRDTNHYGIQRFARDHPYRDRSTSAQKVIFAIAQNEGGGYDTVNAYDQAGLSVGLFHWNNDWLWELLNVYRGNSLGDYQNLLARLPGFDISEGKYPKLFIIDGKTYTIPLSGVQELRRLKFVYRFLQEAGEQGFRDAQLMLAKKWILDMLSQPINGRTMGDYINSELAVALYVDMTVNAGRRGGIERAEDAVRSVFGQTDPNNLNDEQKETLEKGLVEAIKKERRGNEIKKRKSISDPGLREERIENTALNLERNTFKMDSLR
jgi:hypothetical protein